MKLYDLPVHMEGHTMSPALVGTSMPSASTSITALSSFIIGDLQPYSMSEISNRISNIIQRQTAVSSASLLPEQLEMEDPGCEKPIDVADGTTHPTVQSFNLLGLDLEEASTSNTGVSNAGFDKFSTSRVGSVPMAIPKPQTQDVPYEFVNPFDD